MREPARSRVRLELDSLIRDEETGDMARSNGVTETKSSKERLANNETRQRASN